MKISTEVGSISNLVGSERAVELVAKAGFDCWDFSMWGMAPGYNYSTCEVIPSEHILAGKDYLKHARKLKQIGFECGITCNQGHACYPLKIKQIRDTIPRAIECLCEAGGKILVVHPFNDECAEYNAEYFLSILPIAKEYGIEIATENMWNWDNDNKMASFAACATPEDFCKTVDLVGDSHFGACLDIGHAEMMVPSGTANAVDMIYALGDRLKALHIHDNDRRRDQHKLPGEGSIDYKPIIEALYNIGYKGDFTLEADTHYEHFDKADAMECVNQLYSRARMLADKFEALNK